MLKLFKTLQYKLTSSSQLKFASNAFVSESFNIMDNIPELRDEVFSALKDYVYNVLQYDVAFKNINSWVTKVSPKGFSQNHHHKNSWLSGVYYPVGDKGFKIKFHSPVPSFFALKPKKVVHENEEEWVYRVEDNMLLIFPSYLNHEICINNSKKDRYSSGFNIFPTGKLGSGDNSLILT